jgi:hypothetical protein
VASDSKLHATPDSANAAATGAARRLICCGTGTIDTAMLTPVPEPAALYVTLRGFSATIRRASTSTVRRTRRPGIGGRTLRRVFAGAGDKLVLDFSRNPKRRPLRANLRKGLKPAYAYFPLALAGLRNVV